MCWAHAGGLVISVRVCQHTIPRVSLLRKDMVAPTLNGGEAAAPFNVANEPAPVSPLGSPKVLLLRRLMVGRPPPKLFELVVRFVYVWGEAIWGNSSPTIFPSDRCPSMLTLLL